MAVYIMRAQVPAQDSYDYGEATHGHDDYG